MIPLEAANLLQRTFQLHATNQYNNLSGRPKEGKEGHRETGYKLWRRTPENEGTELGDAEETANEKNAQVFILGREPLGQDLVAQAFCIIV